jgi:hypothetical protein
MISHHYKCVFVHIPKTAGQSIELAFLNALNLNWNERAELLLGPNTDPHKGPPRLAHLTIAEYLGYNYLTAQQYGEYFKFAFVRNPWARLVSEYNFSYKKTHTFKNFVLQHFPEPEQDNYQTSKDAYRHIIPQYKYLFDGNGDQLVDFIGRFERLEADFSEICRRLDLPRLQLPRKNSSVTGKKFFERIENSKVAFSAPLFKFFVNGLFEQKKHYTEYYDEKTRQFVAEYYARDIDLFGYEFGKQNSHDFVEK